MVRAITVPAIVALLSSSCADRNRLSALEAKAAALERDVSTLKADLADLEARVRVDETLDAISSVAYLTPSADGYSQIRTDLGFITVYLANVEAYANGSRVTLTFGNPLSATIGNPTLTLEWGTATQTARSTGENVRSKTTQLNRSLQAGGWTSIDVVLDGTPSSELSFVRIKEFKIGQIFLRR